MSIQAKMDTADWSRGLDLLAGPLRTSLARSMAVAGGKVYRDEAKTLAPKEDGVLADAIYLAFQDTRSTAFQVIYSVSWNGRKAPHGHLQEFGHWQPYRVVRLPNGSYFTDKSRPLAEPKWIAAHAFLRPAQHSAEARARESMIRRGRERLPELLAGVSDEP